MSDRPAHDLAGTFLESLAHELRNPLAPIRNSLEVLRQAAPADGAVADAHAILDRQVAHLLRLVDVLLDASHVAQGTVELSRAQRRRSHPRGEGPDTHAYPQAAPRHPAPIVTSAGPRGDELLWMI